MAYKSVGYGQITSLSGAVTLASVAGGIPRGAQSALIQAETQNIRWRDDGPAPTSTVGMVLTAGDSLLYDFPLTVIKFIEVTASAKLNITFYGVDA